MRQSLSRRWATMGVLSLVLASACGPSVEFRGQAVDEPNQPELRGLNWDAQDFDLNDLQGRVTMVFFGYTSCPDVCPFTLAKMKQVFAHLGDRAEKVAVVFASVDPHRDPVEKMAQYVPNFDRRFYGVHLSFKQLEAAKESFSLTVQYGQPQDGPGTDSYYYVDHTGTYFLLDQEGRLRVTFPPNAAAEDIEADIETLLQTGPKS